MQKETETNTGWWTEKPERVDRGTGFGSLEGARSERRDRVWINVALIAALAVALAYSVKMLAGW